MNSETIAIIGSGNMGESLIGGLLKDNYPPDKIWISDPDQQRLKHLELQFGIHTTTENLLAVKSAQIIIFAVKPQIFSAVTSELTPHIQKHKPLIISIAAGIRTSSIQKWLGAEIPIVRTMPNTPALIGCGASALFANPTVSHHQHNAAESIMRALGLVVWLDDEKLMDAVTALSGSGPAYFFLFMESMQQTAEKLGLPKEIARLLTIQTAFGAARMTLESAEPISTLRERVTSKGGTTEAALTIFKNEKLPHIIEKALQAAAIRSDELGNLLDQEK